MKYSKLQKLLIALIGFSLFPAAIFSFNFFGFQLSVFRFLITYISIFIVLPNLSRVRNQYAIFMLLWLLYGVASIVICEDKSAWAREIYFLYVACFSVLICILLLKEFSVFLSGCKLFAIFLLLHNIIGYYEILTRDYHWIQAKSIPYYMRVAVSIPMSVFYNPNDFATVLLFSIAILAICIKFSKYVFERIFYFCLSIATTYLIIRTHSRANLLGLIIGVLAFFLIQRLTHKKLILSLFLILLIGFLFEISSIYSYIQYYVGQFLNFSIEGGSESTRLELLSYGWKVLRSTYGAGSGAGNLANWVSRSRGEMGGSIHFWWLEVLFTYGIFVWIGYIVCYISLIKRCIYNAHKGSFISKIFASFLIAYTIGALSSSSGMNNETIWVAWALIIAYEFNIAGSKYEPRE